MAKRSIMSALAACSWLLRITKAGLISGRLARQILLRTLSERLRPVTLRSSVTKAMPSAIASDG